MAKKKKKKSERKRNLTYGNVSEVIKKESTSDVIGQEKERVQLQKKAADPSFKRELRKNLIFVGVFFLVIIIIYLLLTKTDILNPILNTIGLSGLYN